MGSWSGVFQWLDTNDAYARFCPPPQFDQGEGGKLDSDPQLKNISKVYEKKNVCRCFYTKTGHGDMKKKMVKDYFQISYYKNFRAIIFYNLFVSLLDKRKLH